MATSSVLDQAIARSLGSAPGATVKLSQLAGAPGGTPSDDVLDSAISRALGQKPPAAPVDKSWAAAQYPQLERDEGSRTLYNMTAAMAGQKMATPADQEQFEQGREAGFESAGATALTSIGGELLASKALIQVAGRDPATGRFMAGLATKEGPSLLSQGMKAVQAAGEAHPLVKQALIQGLTVLGAGKIAHALGWLEGK